MAVPRSKNVICNAKHVYEPDVWRCPKCGTTEDGAFTIYDPSEAAHTDCERLHSDDFLVCEACGWEGLGRVAARMWRTQDSMIECPCCKGKGYVKDES